MSDARIIEPPDIAAALWLAHGYEVDRVCLMAGNTESNPEELAAAQSRMRAAATAARAATAYASLFGGEVSV